MKLVRGDRLPREARGQVLAAFVYRWTVENPHRTRAYRCDKCDIREPYVNTASANGHTHPTMPLVSDEQWLREHAFWVTNAGRLARNRDYAEPASLVDCG